MLTQFIKYDKNLKVIIELGDGNQMVLREPIELNINRYAGNGFNYDKYGSQWTEINIKCLDINVIESESIPIPAIPRTCAWCREDISSTPDDANNCYQCGAPLYEEDRDGGATLPAEALPGQIVTFDHQSLPILSLNYEIIQRQLLEAFKLKEEDIK